MQVFTRLGWYFRQQWRAYSLALALLLAVALLNLVPPLLTGHLVDRLSQQTLDHDQLLHLCLLLAGLGGLTYLLRYWWRTTLYRTSYELGRQLRQRLFDHWLRLSPAYFQQQRTGDLMARATQDVTAVEMSAGEGVLTLFDGLLTGLTVVAVMLWLDWRLTLLALLPWPLMGVLMWRFGEALQQHFAAAQARFSELNDHTQESITGLRLIRAYALEPRLSAQFNQRAAAATRDNLAVARVEAGYDPVILLTIAASFLLAMGAGAWLIAQGELTLGALTSFVLYLTHLIWPMFAVGWLLNLTERGAVALARIDTVLATTPAIADQGRALPAADAELRWSIREFRYPEQEHAALQQVEGQLAPGQRVGLVGSVGSGKSTLAALLLRQWEGDGVEITLGGRPLADYPLEALHRHLVVVPQQAFLFSATVAENIALGRPEASMAEIEAAARLASIDEDIQRFPDGYQTLVGERGVTLSGGQKQRLCLARALLLQAPLLILDDALSAVDLLTERRILDNLRDGTRRQGVLIISHRLSALETADRVWVLENGRVAEQGSPAALRAAGGWYADNWRYQQLARAVEEGR